MLEDYKLSAKLAELTTLTPEELQHVSFSKITNDPLINVLRRLIPKYYEESGASAKILMAINKEIASNISVLSNED